MSNLPPPDPGPGGDWSQAPAQPPTQQNDSWGQQPPQVPPTQQQPYATPYAPQMVVNPYDSESTPILVTGILSLALCGPVGIYAWIKGNELRDRAQGAGWPEPGTAKVGRILGIVGTIMFGVTVVFTILYLVLIFAVIGTTATAAG